MISRSERLRRMSVAQSEANLDVVYDVDLFGDFVDVKGETGGDLRHIRVTFNADGSIKYIGEK